MGNRVVTRREDWPERLVDALSARERTPFQYGHHDCVRFGVYLVAAQTYHTEVELLPGFEYGWANEEEAKVALGKVGLLGCARSCARALGLPLIKPNFATRGDPVVVVNDTEPVFGVIAPDGGGAVVAATIGWTILPRNRVIAAWRL